MRAIVCVAALLRLAACGGAPDPTCDDCLARQGAAQGPDGCWPYCGGEEPFPDTDGDGVVDSDDMCQESAETFNGYRDGDGCADAVPPTFVPAALGGSWTGELAMTINGAPRFSEAEQVSVFVANDSQSATIAGFCPDGSGSVEAHAIAGGGATWMGLYSCPPSLWMGCARFSALFFEITIQQGANGTLDLRSSGSAYVTDNDDTDTTTCDVSGEFAGALSGVR